MILGFGNNVVSALASEITASQKNIQVMPGTGAKFATLLTQDNANPSTELDVFAKITLTDSGETEFEICHLLSVSGDMLTVARGQEGTVAKGWMLNDVVANFSTRGSENQFVQIDHLQSGFYCSGVAGGSANALTLNLPSSFFLNGATDWILRTPVIVYPTQDNTGSATLQLILGGKALGTFPLCKGDKEQLVAGDILKDVALVCMLDKSQTFFSVMNPGAIYAGLGTAAFKDIVTSLTDTTAGRLPVVGWMGVGDVVVDMSDNEILSAAQQGSRFFRQGGGNGSSHFGLYGAGVHLDYGLSSDGTRRITGNLFIGGDGNLSVEWVTVNVADGTIAAKNLQKLYGPLNKPTAAETGALPVATSVLSVDLNTLGANAATGVYYQTLNASATVENHYPVAEAGTLLVTPSAYGCQQEYTTFSSGRKFVRGLTGAWNGSDGPWGVWTEILSTTEGDTRYQPKGNYTPEGQAYTKTESDARYIQNVQRGAAVTPPKANEYGPNEAPAGCVLTRAWHDPTTAYGVFFTYRPLQIFINGAWRTIAG